VRHFRFILLPLILIMTWPVAGEDPPAVTSGDEATDELLARERIRASVEAILENYMQGESDGEVVVAKAIAAAESFAALGPDVAPYLINELEQERPGLFDLCAYSLGMLGTPDAEMALRDAAARADDEPGSEALTRKAWALWGLALQGRVDALRLTVEGRHRTFDYAMHHRTSLLEAVAFLTAPASVPVLLELLDVFTADEELYRERKTVLDALRRVGDPSAAPKILPLLEHARPGVRANAASALRTMGTPEAVAALVLALDDEHQVVRQNVAAALEYIGASGQQKKILERLDRETDMYARGSLYRLLADTAGSEAFALLSRYAGREDARDRRHLVAALELVNDPRRLPVLREALSDPDNGVALEAVLVLGRLGDEGAVGALAAAVTDARKNIAQAAAEQLARLEASPTAPAIARRLLDDFLAAPVTDPRQRPGVEKMLEALVALGHTKAVRGLRDVLDRQSDASLRRKIEATIGQLETIQRNRRKIDRWVETSAAEDPVMRQLAWARLGSIGSAEAARVLVTAFDEAERADRTEILRALGEVAASDAVPLLERVLLEPLFDHPHETPLRDMAAWSARRIGGDAMLELLDAAARRRHGRDARVLVYAALLGGDRVLPLLSSLRVPRMRYLGWARGNEQDQLDRIATRLATGRSIERMDVPPRKLRFR
jgi:HEAT repeat protein